jgi:hypothetical protein
MLLPVLKYKHTVEEVSRILKNQSVALDIVSRRVYFCFVIVVVVVHILIVGIVNTSPRPRLHPALPPTPLPSMPEPSPV